MGFIYGIINLDGKPVKIADIQTLSASVKYDHFRDVIESADNWSLGYCYHKDRNPKAEIYKNNDLILLGDVRLYNAPELRKRFDFDSPAEAVAKAYLLWGTQCASHINGDFAVCILDRRSNEVHLFRDHIGARPLTYWFNDHCLIFASHEFGLVKSKLFQCALSEKKMIISFFRFRDDYAQTVFVNVYKVVPGFCESFSSNNKRTTKYWKPENIKQNTTISFDETVKCLSEKLINATLNRKEAGKTGVHVSGGIDSTGIASILADNAENKDDLIGYSWTPENLGIQYSGTNEKELIDIFLRDKNIVVRYANPHENDHFEESLIPEFHGLHLGYSTMKIAANDEVKTLFSGWGGDDFVSISTREVFNHLFFRFKWLTLFRMMLKKGIRSGLMQFKLEVLPVLIPLGFLKIYTPINWSGLRLLKKPFIFKHWRSVLFHRNIKYLGCENRTRFMINRLENHHLPQRMDIWALNAEKFGFEYKYPLLDKDLLEFWFSVPIEYTYIDMKPRFLYREALKGILTETIRIRKDKKDGQLIAYTMHNIRKRYMDIRQPYLATPAHEHLPFFNQKAILRIINQKPKKKFSHELPRLNKVVFYLRYVNLVKKYLSD